MVSPEEKKHIIREFSRLSTREELIELINYSKRIIYGQTVVPVGLQQLNFYSNPRKHGKRYTAFEIGKKSGGKRVINAPVSGLGVIQKCLNLILGCIFQPHPAAMGFVQGRSIFHNAQVHAGNFYVYNIDLRDFFTSIDQARIWKCLQLEPFNLIRDKLGRTSDQLANEKPRLEVANIISAICCTQMTVERNEKGEVRKRIRNVLPQGAPTSPLLSNVICRRLDHLLSGVSRRFGLKYSRYADDITFSSLHNVFQSHNPFITEMRRVISEQGFIINEEKVRLQKSGYRQVVTGLTVNEKVNVSRAFEKDLRRWLYLWERYGYTKSSGIFINTTKNKEAVDKLPELKEVLRGRLAFMKDICGEKNTRLLGYNERFSKLIKQQEILVEKMSPTSVTAQSVGHKLEHFHQMLEEGAIPAANASYEELKEFMEMVHISTMDARSKGKILVVGDDAVHDPLRVVTMLSNFTETSNLKYTTHLWDSNDKFPPYEDFKLSVLSDISTFNFRKLPVYNSRLYWKLIYPFVIQQAAKKNKDGGFFDFSWGKYRLKVGYFYPSIVREWMKKNPGKSPMRMVVPNELCPAEPINGKTLLYFEDFVDVFKSAIEFRQNDLFYLIKGLSREIGADFEVEIIGLRGLNFFTDTHQMESALRLIFNNIRKFRSHPKILVTGLYDESSRIITLEIIHPESYCDKPVNDDKLNLKGKKGDFATLRSLMHSLCDWSIESRFRTGNSYGHFRFDYLCAEGFKGPKEIVSTKGFKHILKFYTSYEKDTNRR